MDVIQFSPLLPKLHGLYTGHANKQASVLVSSKAVAPKPRHSEPSDKGA